MVNLALRPASARDARAIAEIHVAGWRTGYRDLIDGAYLDALSVDDRSRTWEQILLSGAGRILLAEEGPSARGFVAFGPTGDAELPPRTGEVYALYVDPAVWGGGTGGRLLTAASSELANAGRHTAVLWVFEQNSRARRLYELHGWTTDGGRRTQWRDFALDEIRYFKRIS